MIPLEVRFHHDPDSTHGFVAATLSSNVFHWYKNGAGWEVEKAIDIDAISTWVGWIPAYAGMTILRLTGQQ